MDIDIPLHQTGRTDGLETKRSPIEYQPHPTAEEILVETATLYQYFAQLFLDPIAVPGSQYIVDLKERTASLFALHNSDLPGIAELSRWSDLVDRAQTAAQSTPAGQSCEQESLELLQQQLAVDRTYLCRGTDLEGPLSPYEEYYRPTSNNDQHDSASNLAVQASITHAYQAAKVHFAEAGKERDDYLGTEFAFAAHMAAQAVMAFKQGDFDAVERYSSTTTAFENDHLFKWVRLYCEKALPYANTKFFTGVLQLIRASMLR